MPCCAAVNCTNRTEKGFRLFKLPQGQRNEERIIQWTYNIGRKDRLPEELYICEKHFTDDQFELRRADGLKKLKWNAVPTLFYHGIHVAKRKPSRKGIITEATSVQDNLPLDTRMEAIHYPEKERDDDKEEEEEEDSPFQAVKLENSKEIMPFLSIKQEFLEIEEEPGIGSDLVVSGDITDECNTDYKNINLKDGSDEYPMSHCEEETVGNNSELHNTTLPDSGMQLSLNVNPSSLSD